MCQDPQQAYCGNYTDVVDDNNDNVIKGAIVFEGGWHSPNTLGKATLIEDAKLLVLLALLQVQCCAC